MDPSTIALWIVSVPVVVSAVAALIGWRLWDRRGGPLGDGMWSAPVGLALGFVAGYLGLLVIGWGERPWELRFTYHYLLPIVGLGLLVGIAESAFPANWARWATGYFLSALVFALLLYKRKVGDFGEVRVVLLILLMAGAAWAVWRACDTFAARHSGGLLPLVLTIIASTASACLLLGGSIKFGQVTGILAAATGPWLVAGFWKPTVTLTRGALAVWTPIFVTLLTCGYFFADLPAVAALLLAAAPFAAWTEELLPEKFNDPFRVYAATLSVLCVILGGAVLSTYLSSPPLFEYEY